MNTKSKLKAFFNSEQENSQYIEKYEENKDYFDSLLMNGHIEDIEFVVVIKLRNYAVPLKQTGNYKKALSVIAETEKDLEKLKGKTKLYNSYWELATLIKGVCLSRLKKYKDSNVEFGKLLLKFPTNDKYIGWFKSNKKGEIIKILDMISVIGAIFYLIILFTDFSGYKIHNLIMRDFGLALALLAFATSFIWGKVIDKQKIRMEKMATK
jgi:tetratricopeptide (TPR) repeat protein